MTETDPLHPSVDPLLYREVMGHYPTGVVVVTGTATDGEPIGMVVGTFTSVSLDPPLVAFMPTTTSGTYAMMRERGSFCINVLAHDQLDLCRLMAVPRAGKFDEVPWSMSASGAPALDNVLARIHCLREEEVVAGDHIIVLCRIVELEITRPVTPLLFFQGGYGGFSTTGLAAKGDGDVIAALRLAEVARPQIEHLARTLRCESAALVIVNDHEFTTAATAYGGHAEAQESLGVRIPLVPPIGEAYVAWAEEAEQEAWLARAATKDPVALARYRSRLAEVHEAGYAVSFATADGVRDDAVRAALSEYARGELTPSRERVVRDQIAHMGAAFQALDLQEGRTYDLGSIVAPVFDADGRVSMVLRITQLPLQADAATVGGWLSALTKAAAAVHAELNGQSWQAYAEYAATYGTLPS